MNTIIKHIEYLLSRNDCVIVPNLGAFLAHYQCAQIDAEDCAMAPPCRIYTFNSALSQHDGSLAWSVARAEGISYELALEKVNDGAQRMLQFLHRSGVLMVGRVGELTYDVESDTIEFIPAPSDRISYYGALPKVAKREAENDTPLLQIKTEAPWRKIARLAASVALLFLIGFIASTPISVDDAAYASLYPEVRPGSVDDLLPPTPETVGTLNVYVSDKSQLTIDVDSVLMQLEAQDAKYLIIVGSFASEAEAQKHIACQHNPDLGIYEADGRCRVYAAAYHTEMEAYRALTSKFANQGAWVCKKKVSQK